jgi:deoxyribonuclease V
MILAVDVAYRTEGAVAGGILFRDWEDSAPLREITIQISQINPYISGQFYQRELPCILELLKNIPESLEIIVVDGYVYLGREKIPGLGMHLYTALDEQIPIIGVAKTLFKNTDPQTAMYRGHSQHPLYVTSVGIDEQVAREYITKMSGNYRIPTLLRRVDQLCRSIKPVL